MEESKDRYYRHVKFLLILTTVEMSHKNKLLS
jgi:hypothetical protein